MHHRRAVLGLFFVVSFAIAAPAHAQYSSIIAFGDSLTDNGNVFNATTQIFGQGNGFPRPPYSNGRFSNGSVWVEDVAARLNIPLIDFAFGGATTGTANVINGLPGMALEVQQGISTLAPGSARLDSKALYVVWGGANDYFSGQSDPTVVVGNLTNEINALAAKGAVNFLVPNLPDLGRLPLTAGDPSASAGLSLLTDAHNRLLTNALLGLEQSDPSLKIREFDVNHYFQIALDHPDRFNFANVTTNYINSNNQPQGVFPTVNVDPSLDPNTFLFWDEVHPTAPWHARIGQYAIGALAPEPGTLGLMILGVSAIGLRRRLRKPSAR